MRTLLVIVTALLSGCMASAPATTDVAAVISNASPATHAEIEGIIRTALQGAPVTIASDALTRESLIAIERTPRRDPNGMLVNGRDPGKPEVFELRKERNQCVLVKQQTGEKVKLRTVECVAAGIRD